MDHLDTKVVLKGNSDEFETLMVFTDSGITLKCKFNGADEASIAIDETTATYEYNKHYSKAFDN